jgi:hypothetical protein
MSPRPGPVPRRVQVLTLNQLIQTNRATFYANARVTTLGL